MTERDELNVKLMRINLYIDAYNREVDQLENNVKFCTKKAIECKGQGKKNMALYFLSK